MNNMETVVRCNVEKNARLIAQILDFDAEGMEYDWYEQHIDLLAKNLEPKRGDLVEVVRCKECRWLFDDSNTFWKPCEVVIPDNDWFCWCGERREVQDGKD